MISSFFLQTVKKQWSLISTGSSNRRIFGASLIIASLTFAVKIISMVKESFVAASYGTGDAYDAFIIALLIPTAIVGIISSSLNAALIPTYIEVRERESEAAAERLYASVLMYNTLLLIGLTLVISITASWWLPFIASGFSPKKMALAYSLLYWSLPIVLITGFSTTWGAVLNAGERFGLVAIAPGMHPIAIVIALVLMFHSAGIYALLLGTVLGAALEAALVGRALAQRGHPLLPRWYGITAPVREVKRQYGACIAGALLMTGTMLTDQAMASMLGPRSNSALSYGSKLVALALSLGATALGTAVLPQFSRLVATKDWDGLRGCIKTYTRLVIVITVPATIFLILCSPILIRILYQRGAFSEADTQLVATVQSFYLLRLPFSVALVLVTRAITAVKANIVMTVVSIGTLILNVLLNYIFMHKFGVAGITLSTSACSVFVFITLTVILFCYLLPKLN